VVEKDDFPKIVPKYWLCALGMPLEREFRGRTKKGFLARHSDVPRISCCLSRSIVDALPRAEGLRLAAEGLEHEEGAAHLGPHTRPRYTN